MLDTYDNLVKEIIDWSHRDDLGVKVPGFIQLAENAMYSNEVEVLAIRGMEMISTSTTTGQYVALPTDFESARSVRLVTGDNGGELRFQAPEQMRKQVATGKPTFFTVIGNEIQFDRVPDSAYTLEIQYYRKEPSLSTLIQTNAILTSHPSIYLYGALAQVYFFSQDEQQALKYTQLFISAIKGANKADKKGRYGPAPAMSIDGMIV
tara:strand:- start:520 stop:1140 length:621 start_codon:yes stop_codon:yes gene_type:complete